MIEKLKHHHKYGKNDHNEHIEWDEYADDEMGNKLNEIIDVVNKLEELSSALVKKMQIDDLRDSFRKLQQ